MVSSHSFTELQLLRSGMALSIRGGLSKLWWGGGGEELVGGSLKMREDSEVRKRRSERASERGEGGL